MEWLKQKLFWVNQNFKKENKMRLRDFHKLAIVRREARGNTTYVPSKRAYTRKKKHKCKGEV